MVRSIAVPALLVVLAACSPSYRGHGYVPTEAELASVVVGKDTRETVATTIGRPTASGIEADSGWYYVESKFRLRGPFAPQEVERQVVAVSFDGRDRVANIERFGLEDGRIVRLSRRVTEISADQQPYLQQLLGRVGGALF